MTEPTFSVCALVREKPDILDRFARYYLALGAERVRFFFDGTAEEAHAPDLPGVELTVCDRAFWQARLGRPAETMRDAHDAVFAEATGTATSDWQFFCDADEYLVSDRPVAEVLARVPDDCPSLRIMNVEAVWGPGDPVGAPFACTHFRILLNARKERLLRLLLPMRRWEMFRHGYTGHMEGKHFLRRGARVDRYDCHRSWRDDRTLGIWGEALGFGIRELFLAHFDAVSEARWTEKWRRRLSNERPAAMMKSERHAQVAAMRAAEAAGTTPALFRALYAITPYEAFVRRLGRVLIRRRIFPEDPRS